MAKKPSCEVTFTFFRMRDLKAFCAKTGKLSEAFRPSFCQFSKKAKKLPKKIGNEQNGLFAILMNSCRIVTLKFDKPHASVIGFKIEAMRKRLTGFHWRATDTLYK